jgi:hypothetical protein
MTAFAMGLAVLCLAGGLQAQQSDVAQIYLQHSVTIGHKTLEKGLYSVEKMDLAGGDSPVLVLRGENGARTETSARAMPIVENRTQPETRVLLARVAGKYYLDKIWIKGWSYGFQFTVPKDGGQ